MWRKSRTPLLLFASCIAREALRDRRGPLVGSRAEHLSVDLAQLAVVLVGAYLVRRPGSGSKAYELLERERDEDEPDAEAAIDSASTSAIATGSARFYTLGGAIGALYALQAFTDAQSAKVANLTELHAALPACTLLLLGYLELAFRRAVASATWANVALQFCGLYMVKSTVSARFIHSSISPATSFALVSALAFITSYYTLRRLDRSFAAFARLAVVIFGAKLAVALALAGIDRASSAKDVLPIARSFDLLGALLLAVECCRGLCVLLTLRSYDVVSVSVLLTLANLCWLAGSTLLARLFTFGALGGCAVALVAAYAYLDHGAPSDEFARETFSPLRFLGITSILFVLLVSHASQPSAPQSPPSVAQLFRFEASHPHCYPRTAPASLRPLWERDYHAFDGVLLIVFFSHARYDVNLDFYREVYAKYFPNIVFIGPASREDAGFAHSFDVVLNSYHSDEDLAIDPDTGLPTKMAGRMAHHMLYQALAENPCGYDGYLWAPFDTLLNVPRLQQFDQTRFWYHSPWAQYVPNPGAPDTGNVSHAPAATISPELYPVDPADRYKQNWWWGSKEYGLEVCVPALEKVRLRLRERLAEYNGGTPRLIGGSSDTVYIPGQHATAFRETLGIFLETTCFLEIATPTTLHLVAPRDEPIMFVDHWWIWYPPFNTSFVRQKWAEGSEVDTFHTFHWGDSDADGVWRAHPGIVEDVRGVLAESAVRQGIDWK